MYLGWLCFTVFVLPVLWLAGILMFAVVVGIIREFHHFSEPDDERDLG
jgi:hypothetical protein